MTREQQISREKRLSIGKIRTFKYEDDQTRELFIFEDGQLSEYSCTRYKNIEISIPDSIIPSYDELSGKTTQGWTNTVQE